LLSEAHAENTQFEEADMVSSMLTAIQDFAHDSFAKHLDSGDTLDTIRLHDFNVWIEDGPFAYLAVVFEGEAPESNRELFKISLEKIHRNYASLVQNFDGDDSGAEVLQPVLQDCVISQGNIVKKSNKKVLYVALAFLVLLGVWIGFSVQKSMKWNRFLEELDSQPSVVVIDQGKESGKYFVKGMKDAIAPDFYNLALENKLDTSKVVLNWTNYISLAKPYYLKRLKKVVLPDSSVEIFFKKEVVFFEGKATHNWIIKAKAYCLNQDGVFGFDFSNLKDSELDSIQMIITEIENLRLEFAVGVSILNKKQKAELNKLVSYFSKLKSYRPQAAAVIHVVLDDNGSKLDNERFAKQRFNSSKRYLKLQGFNTDFIESKINIASETNKPRTLKFKIN